MKGIIPFNFEGDAIRVVERNDAPWFVATDVCRVLDIVNSRDALAKLDDDERADVGLTDISSNGVQQQRSFSVVNESGLYTLVLRCREATTPGTLSHRFRKWVTSEVLPSIRKHGFYGRPQSVAQILALQKQTMVLMKALRRESDPSMRGVLSGQLEQILRMQGLPSIPDPDSLAPAPEHPLIADFWEVFDYLDQLSERTRLNHSSNPDLIAVNLNHFAQVAAEARQPIPLLSELKRVLKDSKSRKYIDQRMVRSAINKEHNRHAAEDPRPETLKCWIFAKPGDFV